MCQWEDTLIRENRWYDGFNRPCRVLFPIVDVVAKQMFVKQTEFCVQRESRPKAFDMSAGITHLPITSWSVDNIHNRVVCCTFISQHKLRYAWLISVLITHNRLISMSKWFTGCGNKSFTKSGVARGMAFASSTIFAFDIEDTNIHGAK